MVQLFDLPSDLIVKGISDLRTALLLLEAGNDSLLSVHLQNLQNEVWYNYVQNSKDQLNSFGAECQAKIKQWASAIALLSPATV